MPISGTDTTPAQALTAVREYFLALDADRAEFKAWASGEADGGPNSDGQYPLTDFTGAEYLVDCPAKIAGTVEETMDGLVSKGYATWAALHAVTGATNTVLAAVSGDAGTHEDPLTNLTVPNSGLYIWSTAETDWVQIATFPPLLDTDAAMAANSDTRVPSQKAVKTAISAALLGQMELKGEIDCSGSPNFPAASRGDCYVVSVAGLIGNVLGLYVRVGTLLIAQNDNAGGDLETAGVDWFVVGNASGDGGTGGSGTAGPAEIVEVADGGYSLLDVDSGKFFRLSDADPKPITVPTNAVSAMSDDVEFHFYNSGAGDATITPADGVTVRAPAGGSLVVPQYGTVTLKRAAINSWDVFGLTVTEEAGGGVEFADYVETREMVIDDKAVSPADLAGLFSPVLMTGATGATALDLANSAYHISMVGNITLSNPTNSMDGRMGWLTFKQDATGGRTLTLGSWWESIGTDATLNTAANSETSFLYFVQEGGVKIKLIKLNQTAATTYTDEMAQDAIGAMVDTSLTYTDATPALGINTTLEAERIRDVVAAMLAAGTHTNITITNDDAGDSMSFAATGGGGGVTLEQVMDQVATMLTQGVGIVLTYNDAGDIETIDNAFKYYPIPVGFTTAPTASEVLLIHVFTETVVFPANFSSAQKRVGTNPAATFAVDVQRSVAGAAYASIGSLSLSTGGALTGATTGGAAMTFNAGDAMMWIAPATPDASIANTGITLKGTRS